MAEVVLNIKTQIADLQKGLKKVQAGQKNMARQSTKTQKAMQKNIQGTTKSVQGLGAAFLAVVSIAAVTRLAKSIISVRGEFATFEAVLINTLGSAQKAQKEFDKIQKFAAETPFSVRELTDSFVRLVNQGFKPTTDQLRKLGDLAASTGKEFIMLTEAIIDAQVGEFERLKEFGIRASKQGDLVTFTFKEVETQVDFTASAIQGYILSLGDLEGVTGAMAAISETLNGQISMLTDSWDALLNVLGGRTEGVFIKVMSLIKGVIDGIKVFNELAEPETAGRRRANVILSMLGDDFDEAELAVINRRIKSFTFEMLLLQTSILTLQGQGGTGMLGGVLVMDKSKLGDMIEQRDELMALIKTLQFATETTEENTGAAEESGKSLKELAKERKELIKSLALTQKLEEEEAKHFESMTDFIMGFGNIAIDESESITDQLKQDATDKANHIIAENERIAASERQLALIRMTMLQARGEAVLAGLDLLAAVTKENAIAQQAIAISQAIINGALQIVKIGSQAGVFALPLQIAAGLQTLAQIAIIKGEKFERGGYDVLKGRRHAQGGVDIGIGEAEAGEGLAVFSRTATKKYGKFLPAFVKAINENDAEMGYSDGAYMINFDDSKSVGKLEDIRQLLSKPEIRYEGRYRIETRKGQVTRVKI